MIGVVVWSSADREKAVIWCEDHAALAYLQGRDNLSHAACWPQPGDLVELESEIVGPLRHARRVTMLSEQEFPHLPAMLRNNAAPSDSHLRIVSSTSHPESRDRATAEPERRAAAAG
ncbi:hypothetical protein EYF88_01630 [Paracoccus sediminis]|uniref:Cold shock protein, CspA family n=2 Tax=Paracoccus sediminis TaxID=1214787 RepID=A0A238UQN4_9RHOB|nr:hypothetical protein EYF88_01630 [Paracoccus sediminis]SNR24326.1 hypothetical protein SAMN06265378_101297 [Paracoccus sediminis]